MRAFGIILIIVGILAIALPYIPIIREEKILEIGPIEATTQKEERVPVSPIVGIVILVAGAGITIASVVKKRS